jgi:hypothetical protein
MRKNPRPQNYHVCEITYLTHDDVKQDDKGAILLEVIQDLACEFINLRERVRQLEFSNSKLVKHIEVLEAERE